jgi:hypothetical protein
MSRILACLDLDALNETALAQEPYPFLIVPRFVRAGDFQDLLEAFPSVPGPGAFPPHTLKIDSAFEALLADLRGDAFREAIERKFAIDLERRGQLTTIRGHARAKDGTVHTDSASKLITALLYMEDTWAQEGGRLRLLKSANLEDVSVEVPPTRGTLVVFQRSDRSWHGHKPCQGPRRVIQFNWLTGEASAMHHNRRHSLSAFFKKIARSVRP